MSELRLLAEVPSAPSWLGADGTRVGFAVGATLSILGSERRDLELPGEVLAVAPTASRWTVVTRAATCLVDPASARVVSLLDPGERPVAIHPGAEELVAIGVPVNRRLGTDDGRERFLPDGALRSRWLRPWLSGEGAAWIDMDHVYRVQGDVVRAVGRVRGATAFLVGPRGALIVAGGDLAAGGAPGKLLVEIAQPVEVEDATFSPDGSRALAEDDEGAVEIELETGSVARRWEGEWVPAGYAPGPVLWDVEAGRLLVSPP